MADSFEYIEYTPQTLSPDDIKGRVNTLIESITHVTSLLISSESVDDYYTIPMIENVVDMAFNNIVIRQIISQYKSINADYGRAVAKQLEVMLSTLAILISNAKGAEVLLDVSIISETGEYIDHPIFETIVKCINDLKDPQGWSSRMDMSKRKKSTRRKRH